MSRVYDVFLLVRAWLRDEGESPMTPDYINDILARTAVSKQRPAWQSPWRWLLMQTTDTIRTVPRIAWPVLILLIVAALAFGVAASPGTPSPSPSPAPAPLHGPAANGLIAFAAAYSKTDGTATIWVVNPDGTDRHALISSPDDLDGLTWAPDGRHLAYWAWSGGQATERMKLMVADADGNRSRALFDNGVTAAPPVAWSPDSTMIAIDDGKAPNSTTSVIDATTGTVILTHDGSMPTWSPDSSRLAIVAGTTLQIVGLDGVVETTLGHGVNHPDWSPDGKHIADAGPGVASHVLVVVVDDGTVHDITDPTNQVSRRRVLPHWSPDGSQIEYEDSGFGDNNGRGISVWDGTGGAVTWLDIPRFGARWSPDGLTILSHDGDYATSMFITDPTGVRPQTTIDVSDLHAGQLSMSWQRVAP